VTAELICGKGICRFRNSDAICYEVKKSRKSVYLVWVRQGMEEETFHIQEMGSRYPKSRDAGGWLWDSGIRMYFLEADILFSGENSGKVL
jgi:hypothetical protein